MGDEIDIRPYLVAAAKNKVPIIVLRRAADLLIRKNIQDGKPLQTFADVDVFIKADVNGDDMLDQDEVNRITNLSRKNPGKITEEDVETLKQEKLANVEHILFAAGVFSFPARLERLKNHIEKHIKQQEGMIGDKGDVFDRQAHVLKKLLTIIDKVAAQGGAPEIVSLDEIGALCSRDGNQDLTMKDLKIAEAEFAIK